MAARAFIHRVVDHLIKRWATPWPCWWPMYMARAACAPVSSPFKDLDRLGAVGVLDSGDRSGQMLSGGGDGRVERP